MSEDLCPDFTTITKQESCSLCMENNILLPIFFFSSFIPFTILFSSWIVAKFIYLPHINSIKNEVLEVLEEEEEEILYEDKYPIDQEYINKDFKVDNNYVCESTPDGLVFLKFNERDESFNWWSDNQNVAYKYLETVARKYVKVYKCTNLYIDRKKEIQKQIDREKQLEEKQKMESEDKKEEAEDSDEDLFVKFKPSEKIKPKKDKNKAAVRGNKYKYYGKISDFKMIKKIIKKTEGKKKIDFSAWKNMLKM